MIWFEILGPSGVGKSYWYEKFIRKYPEYEPKQLVLNNIYKSKEFNKLPIGVKLRFWIYMLNIYRISNHYKHKLTAYFFKNFQRKSKSIFTEEDDLIIKQILANIDSLDEPQIIVLKKIAYINEKLTELKFYQFYLKENDIYLAEDGLMHLAPVFITELQADYMLILKRNYKNLQNQRLSRAVKKPTTFIEFLLEEDQLKIYINEYYKFYDIKIKSITREIDPSRIKTIDLETADTIQEMRDFICKI